MCRGNLSWVTRVTWVDMGVRGDLVLISKTMHRRERSGKCVEEIFHSMLWTIIALEDLSPFTAKKKQIHILFGVQELYIVHSSVLEKIENGIRSEQK